MSLTIRKFKGILPYFKGAEQMKNRQNKNRINLQVQFRHMPKSNSIRQWIEKQANHLKKFTEEDSHCKVVIDETHHWKKGGVFRVSIQLSVPGQRLYVASYEEESGSHEFLYSAVRMAFEEIERQLKKHRRRSYRRKLAEMAA